MTLEHVKTALYAGELGPAGIAALLVISFLLGTVHALGPGHGKSLLAAYVLGERGRIRDVLLMALSLSTVHVASVVVVGLVTVWIADAFWPEAATKWLSLVAGVGILAVGMWLFYQRAREAIWLRWTAKAAAFYASYEEPAPERHSPAPPGHSAGEHGAGAAHAHLHVHWEPGRAWWSTLGLGISGGVVPCPKAIVILLLALSLHRLALGLAVIGAFSLGIAATLVALGLSIVWFGSSVVDRLGNRTVSLLPVGAALVIVAIGAVLVVRTLSVL